MVSQELYRKAAEIFLRVVDLPAPERADALDRACAGTTELRKEVESLLRFHLQQEGGPSTSDVPHGPPAD